MSSVDNDYIFVIGFDCVRMRSSFAFKMTMKCPHAELQLPHAEIIRVQIAFANPSSKCEF